jgi:BirA family biotin operon repressor/biotin-[acetyl-CoA-carboxylase] ligase
VAGVGINYDLRGEPDAAEITSRLGHVSDLTECMKDRPSRSVASAAIIEGLFNTLAEFEAYGFEQFASAWEKYDWLRGQIISVEQAGHRVRGTCQGIDRDGALILRTATGPERVTSGTVSFGGRLMGLPGGKQ